MDAASQAAAAALRASPPVNPFAVMNAVGLVASALVGSSKAIREEFDRFGIAIVATALKMLAFGVVAVATVKAVGGVPADGEGSSEERSESDGVLADILLDRAPFVLFDDFYASGAVLGGTAYPLVDLAGATGRAAAVICVVVTVVTRLLAVTRDRELLTIRRLRLRKGDRSSVDSV